MQFDLTEERHDFKKLMGRLTKRSEYLARYYDAAKGLLTELRAQHGACKASELSAVTERSSTLCRLLEEETRLDLHNVTPLCLFITARRFGNEAEFMQVFAVMSEVACEILKPDFVHQSVPPPAA
ncbi:MAG: hypothetical protein WC641_03630 [Patescibacteria group bacterium]